MLRVMHIARLSLYIMATCTPFPTLINQRIREKRKEVEDAGELLKEEKLEAKNFEDKARELVKERCVKKGEVESARESVIKLGMEMKILETDIFNLQRSLNK